MWPGVSKPLELTVTNVNWEPVRLLTLDVDANNPYGCTARTNLRITTYDARRRGAGPITVVSLTGGAP